MLVYYNNSLVPSATIGASTSAALYGKGVFTTVRICDGDPFLWPKHWWRLRESSEKLGISLEGVAEDETHQALGELIRSNGITNGRARLTFFDESESVLWATHLKPGVSLLIMTAALVPHSNAFRLTLSPYPISSRSPLIGIKSCNYLDKLMTKREAKDRGFDECVQLNERGDVVSASMANIFWLRDGQLFTPSLATGCLPGTTREFILENVNCEEVEADIDTLRTADEIFLTSAGLGVVQVQEFDDRSFAQEPHEITRLVPG